MCILGWPWTSGLPASEMEISKYHKILTKKRKGRNRAWEEITWPLMRAGMLSPSKEKEIQLKNNYNSCYFLLYSPLFCCINQSHCFIVLNSWFVSNRFYAVGTRRILQSCCCHLVLLRFSSQFPSPSQLLHLLVKIIITP